MTKFSKKIRLYKKNLSNKKKHIAGAPEKKVNIEINYNGPLIPLDLWRRFLMELRMGTGYNLTKTISTILNDPYLTVCKSSAIVRITHNPDIKLSSIENSIMISCDEKIPHYYVFKPHLINLIKAVILRGEFDHELSTYIPLKTGINLFIQNGDELEHDVISDF
jgi:hypothetical protein